MRGQCFRRSALARPEGWNRWPFVRARLRRQGQRMRSSCHFFLLLARPVPMAPCLHQSQARERALQAPPILTARAEVAQHVGLASLELWQRRATGEASRHRYSGR